MSNEIFAKILYAAVILILGTFLLHGWIKTRTFRTARDFVWLGLFLFLIPVAAGSTFFISSRQVIPLRFSLPYLLDYSRWSRIGRLSIWQWLPVVWAAVACIKLIRFFKANRKQQQILAQIRETSVTNHSGSVPVYNSTEISEPFCAGLFHPAVYLPAALTPEGRCSVLSHELAHIRHHDLWIRMGVALVSCILWWIPVWRFLLQDLLLIQEVNCDLTVIGHRSELERLIYYETILKEQSRKPVYTELQMGYSSSFALQRMEMALSYKRKPVSRAVLLIASGLFLILSFTFSFQLDYSMKGAYQQAFAGMYQMKDMSELTEREGEWYLIMADGVQARIVDPKDPMFWKLKSHESEGVLAAAARSYPLADSEAETIYLRKNEQVWQAGTYDRTTGQWTSEWTMI